MERTVRVAAALVWGGAAVAGGCNCRPEVSDAGSESGSNLLDTRTSIAVTSMVAGIEQLHVTMVAADPPNMGGMCAYAGNLYEGWVPPIVTDPLDLTCTDPAFPTTCSHFDVLWTSGSSCPAAADLGCLPITGVGMINCQITVTVEGLGAGGAPIAFGNMATEFANYGAVSGPRELITLQ